MSPVHVCSKMLVALICVASINASSQSELPPDVTRYNYSIAGAPGASVSGEALEAAVARELEHDPLIVTETIEVGARDHIVTLTGTQPLLIGRERATYVAETVRGVRQVINEIQVDSGREVDGERLESDIAYALLTDPATERREFTVEASDTGNVALGGEVESGAERTIAENIVKSIAGVRSVVNNVELTRALRRSDEQIHADVMRMLQWDAYVDSGDVRVAVEDGIVTLSGVVDTPAEKRRAVGLSWVAGVRHVNVVPVQVKAGEPERPGQALSQSPNAGAELEMRSDEAVAEAVRRALARDPRVSLANIDVSVEDRVVTLSGTAANLRAKRIAASTPCGILGVASVRNHIRLPKTGEYDDDEIRFRVQRLVEKSSLLHDDPITVLVRDGVVTLNGTVDNGYLRALAADLASAVRGVTRIQNNVDVGQDAEHFSYDPYVDFDGGVGLPWEYPPADETRTASDAADDGPTAESVRSELWWSPFVNEEDIAVSVRGAVVTLRGTVDSEAERRAAIENAFEGGAVSVINELVVAAD